LQESTLTPGTPYPAVLAAYGPSPCSNKAYDNSASFTVVGDVISNSGIHDSSTGTTISGSVSYVAGPASTPPGPNVCGPQDTSQPGWTGTAAMNPTNFPVTYSFDATLRKITNTTSGASAPCTYFFTGSTTLGNGPWWSGGVSSSRQLMPGVYCS